MKTKIALIGYSGHAYVCIETAQAMGLEILGYYELQESSSNPYHLPFLGKEETFQKHDGLLFGGLGKNLLFQIN